MARSSSWAVVLWALVLARCALPAPAQQPGDTPLTEAQVRSWFDTTLKRGDGTPLPLRSGNVVTPLLDGPETFAAMVAAIKTASAPVDDPEAVRPAYFALRSFGADPADPWWAKEVGAIAEGADGWLYSTAPNGGRNARGAAFKVSPDGKQLTVLHHFDVATGAGPNSGLTLARDGSFYGTTYEGGKYGGGTIFRIGPTGGHSVVWDFRNGRVVPPPVYPRQPTEQEKLDAAGSYPLAPPIVGRDGSLYGVAAHANNQQYGVLYSGTLRGLRIFTGESGRLPLCLVAGADGSLYGTTTKGDATCPYGTVFRASTAGSIGAIHRFDIARGYGGGGLMQASDGSLYGTCPLGGPGRAGVVYRLTTGGAHTVLHAFTGRDDGAGPVAGLAEGRDGYLYGTTTGGGTGRRGTVYRIRRDGTGFAVLYNFLGNWSTGRHARTSPVRHSNGDLYGITYQGGTHDRGVFYRIRVPRFVYLLGWWLSDDFVMVPGDAASTFGQLAQEASRKGVQVRGMLSKHLVSHPAEPIARLDALANGAAIHDNLHLNFGSHHQKLLVVSGSTGLIAFCGGIDINPDRLHATGQGPNAAGDTVGAPLHDVHLRVMGPAAGDLLDVFTARWNDHPDHSARDTAKGALQVTAESLPPPIAGATHWVQVGRTFGNGPKYVLDIREARRYGFAPAGEQSAARMILKGIRQARRFIYVEDQYFVDTAPNAAGLDVRAALIEALRKPGFEHLTVLIPHGSISDMPQVNYRRQQLIRALRAAAPGKVRVFVRRPVEGAHSYVHAKAWVFDDEYAIVGSVNTNRRSWTHDSEVVVGVCDQGKEGSTELRLPHLLRMRLWLEHLGMADTPANRERVRDGVASAALWLADAARGRVWPLDENADIELIHTDTAWNQEDPDGS